MSAQYVKRGGKVYGPYWSRMWRENCVLRKRYVRPADLDAVSAACRAWREMRTRVREFREQARRSRAESAVMVRALRLIEQDPDHGLERLSASDQALLAGIVGSGL